jgi:hypothetical protein
MAKCHHCGTFILFGGVEHGSRRFCSLDCRLEGSFASLADEAPEEIVAKRVEEIHQGDCPKCGGPGPVDVYHSHTTWTSFTEVEHEVTAEVCCRDCGNRVKLLSSVTSLGGGWPGIIVGLVMTPIHILRYSFGLFCPADPHRPSASLEEWVRMELAGQVSKARRANEGIRYTADDPIQKDSSRESDGR